MSIKNPEVALARIQAAHDACKKAEDEITLAGNGVNSSEALLTLGWVLRVLRGEPTSEILPGPAEDEEA